MSLKSSTDPSKKFRILSLDGGGIRGAYTASVLRAIEQRLGQGRPLIDYFDLIAGTSTGGIIAIALAYKKTPQEVVDLYLRHGDKIFPTRTAPVRLLLGVKQLLFSPYSQQRLQDVIESVIGKEKFRDAKKRLVIPAYNATDRNVHVFKHMLPQDAVTITASGYQWRHYERFDNIKASELAVATAAAPTFFPTKRLMKGGLKGKEFIDGGIWANSPLLPAIAEALGPLGIARENIRVLSVGTRFERLAIGKWMKVGGFLPWNAKVISLLQNAQAAGSIGTTRFLLGEVQPYDPRFYRIDDERISEQKPWWSWWRRSDSPKNPAISLADVAQVPVLVNLAEKQVEVEWGKIQAFFDHHLYCARS